MTTAQNTEGAGAAAVNSPPVEPPLAPRKKWRWQWSLTTLLLFTAAIAAWVGWRQVSAQSQQLRREIETMQRLQRKLIVTDSQKYAVIELLENWYDEDRWDVHLPAGHKYLLKLATHGIHDQELPTAGEETSIPPGRHTLEVLTRELSDSQQWEIVVKVDERPALSITEPKDWKTTGSSDNVGYESQQELPVDKPLIIKRRRHTVRQPNGNSTTPQGPASGILLWIESSAIASKDKSP